MIKDCTVVILAGGESRRMGQDKASVKLANGTLLNRAIRVMQPLFKKLIISVREPRENLLFSQLCDRGNDRGPIMGIMTALERVDTQWVFVLACDMPFISPEMVVSMATHREGRDMVVPCVDHMLQPLAAFYSKNCLAQMGSQVSDGQRSLKILIGKMDAAIIPEEELMLCDPELLSFMDMDTQADVAQAEAVLAKGSVE